MFERIKNSLTVRILFWFLAISLIPLLTISILSYQTSDKALGNSELNSLKAISLGGEELVISHVEGEMATLEALALQDSLNPETLKIQNSTNVV